MLLATVEHLAEVLDLNTLLTPKMEKFLISLEGTLRITVSIIEGKTILLLKH
jgi:hypothetical protein